MSETQAAQQLASGRVAAVVTVPQGFVADLKGLVSSPHLTLATGSGGITPRVRQQMQALVYNLNLKLQKAFIQADLKYVDLLLHGGKGRVLGHDFSIIGLDGTKRLLVNVPDSPQKTKIADFVDDARLALALTGNAIRATASPVVLDEEKGRGRTSLLSAQVQAYGLAITISFLGLLLAGGALAAERDENAIGRLVRGLVGLGQLIVAKIALAVTVALGVGFVILVGFGIAVEAGGVHGGEPWQRLPLVLVGVLLAGAAIGAVGTLVGALTRESRTASLVGDPGRPPGRLPRPRTEGDRPGRSLDQRCLSVRPRRSLLRVGPVRRLAVGDRRARGRLAGRAGSAVRCARAAVRPPPHRLVRALPAASNSWRETRTGRRARTTLQGVGAFPVTRLRRLRRTGALRTLVRETQARPRRLRHAALRRAPLGAERGAAGDGPLVGGRRRRGGRPARGRRRGRRDPVRDPGREGRGGLRRVGRRRRHPARAARATAALPRAGTAHRRLPLRVHGPRPLRRDRRRSRSTTTRRSTCSPARRCRTSTPAPMRSARAT